MSDVSQKKWVMSVRRNEWCQSEEMSEYQSEEMSDVSQKTWVMSVSLADDVTDVMIEALTLSSYTVW